MKKLMILSALVLLSSACARLDGDKRNQNANNFGLNQQRPLTQPRPINQIQLPQTAQQRPNQVGVQAVPVQGVGIKTVCAPNVRRVTRVVRVERIDRKSADKFMVFDGSTLSSKETTEIALIGVPPKKALVSRKSKNGPVTEEDESYDFTQKQITNEDDLKLRFSLVKGETQKYALNEADLTAHAYADIDMDTPQLTTKGFETTCSFIAKGSFSIDEESKTLKAVVTMTETYQLDVVAMKNLIKRHRSKKN